MMKLKEAIEKATGKRVNAIFAYNLNKGGYVDYSYDESTHSIKYSEIEKYLVK